MHKIKKYQTPNTGLINLNTDLSLYFKHMNQNLAAGIKRPAALDSGRNTNLIQALTPKPANPITSMFPQQKSATQKMFEPAKGTLAGKGIMKNFSSYIPGLVDSGLDIIGVKKAETMGGVEAGITQGMKTAGSALMKVNPLIGGAVYGLAMLNERAGNTNKEQGTIGLNVGPDSLEVSSNAGLKNSLIGTIFGKKKKTDNRTKSVDITNLKKGRRAYDSNQANVLASNMYGNISNQNQQKLAGGIGTSVLSAKKGAKINPKKLSNIKKKAQYKIKKAQEGTFTNIQMQALGGQLNVIPEGALHARLNNYGGELGEQVTSKGIPVITYDDNDKIVQHAEIEHSEIIFTKEVTTKLETWFKEYNDANQNRKRELELECGKFLTEEILENTEDKVGLIDKTE